MELAGVGMVLAKEGMVPASDCGGCQPNELLHPPNHRASDLLPRSLWSRQKENLPAGRLLGIFLIWCFGLRFVFEYLKENQESFEDNMILNMGQILSIPLVIAGIVILLLSYQKKEQQNP